MHGRDRQILAIFLSTILALSLVAGLASCSSGKSGKAAPASNARYKPTAPPATAVAQAPAAPNIGYPPRPGAIMLGVDVLEAQGFTAVAGKKIGLLSHPAGVNRNGISTIDVLRRAPNARLVALFGPEHGIYGNAPASQNIADTTDARTGLPAYSLYGKNRKPTPAQLKNLDALVIDLQDIGVRSYTFSVCMKYAIEACFENNVEVIVLDRPNPLGGLKVDGPILDRSLFSGVGAYQIPYVHGLTMGELARMAVGTPGWLDVPETVRAKGRLSVVPMGGWRRAMRWPDTGLNFVATSPYVQDFSAVMGYAMTGLGCQIGGFRHGIGTQYPFRGLSHNGRSVDELLRQLNALGVSGLAFRKVTLTAPKGGASKGIGLYVDVVNWDAWRPTELSFYLMRLACQLGGNNPFAAAKPADARSFNIHTGSPEWWDALKRDGAKVSVASFVQKWQREAAAYQQASRKFWLYN
ncbi:DUF1343 domain-containing protein [Termitidicoccus mucosus]|uniref:DUF1343 domain-containing protein n=1 Tax=Termitidicoccus mucosus TaxID=1184151 RepID=A0A178IFM4_9BACT|nr:hypothetical protein AW736_17470 [Opitutaceae bacterium TSB47]